jgi:hypothetical protein
VAALAQHDAAEAVRLQNLRSALTASLLLSPKTSTLKVIAAAAASEQCILALQHIM